MPAHCHCASGWFPGQAVHGCFRQRFEPGVQMRKLCPGDTITISAFQQIWRSFEERSVWNNFEQQSPQSRQSNLKTCKRVISTKPATLFKDIKNQYSIVWPFRITNLYKKKNIIIFYKWYFKKPCKKKIIKIIIIYIYIYIF